MTPKEKANELVDKFYQTTPNEAWVNEPLGISEEYKAWKQAKQCALIAIDEIIASNPIAFDEDDNCIAKHWWKEVKTEIEKL